MYRFNTLFFVLPAIVLASAITASNAQASGSDDLTQILQAVGVDRRLPPPAAPVIVAVVDDAFEFNHTALQRFQVVLPNELAGNGYDDDGNGVIDDRSGWDVADADGDVAPAPGHTDLYHGTHVASILATAARVAWGERAPEFLKILPVKSIPDDASSTYLYNAWDGLDYAVDAGANIVVTAWSMHTIPAAARAALARAEAKGVLVVSSTSNLGDEVPRFPAAIDTVLGVAATNVAGQMWEKSGYGQYIDLAAPGVGIPGADFRTPDAWKPRDGASFSTALVGAVAALLRATRPELSPSEVRACLVNTAQAHVGLQDRYLGKLGAGLVDAAAALGCKTSTAGTVSSATTRYFMPLPDAEQATWTVKPPGRHRAMTFKVRYTGSPPSGRLEFSGPEQPPQQYSFRELPAIVHVPGPEAMVTWFRGGDPDATTGKGTPKQASDTNWYIQYEAETIDFTREHCRDTVEVTEPGILHDGSGPEPYAWNSSCKWQINAPPGKVVRFEFDEFETEPNRDLIYFFDGNGTHAKIMAVFSGKRPPALTSWRNSVLMWFVTDVENQFDGWRARVTFVDAPAD